MRTLKTLHTGIIAITTLCALGLNLAYRLWLKPLGDMFLRVWKRLQSKLVTPTRPNYSFSTVFKGQQRKPLDPGPVELLTGTTDQIRKAHAVQAIHRLDDGRPLKELPDGVYGYTTAWSIRTDGSCVVGGTGVDRVTLRSRPGGTVQLEFHKTPQEIYILGYATLTDLDRLSKSKNKGSVTLMNQPGLSDFNHPVAVPVSRIWNYRDRGLESFHYALDIVLA